MTTASCEMVGLVEARHDRRLGAPEAASLERHLESCATCRELAADLERMADLAQGASDAAPLPELERRRNRLRLLKAAARPHREGKRRFDAWQLAAATLLCGGIAAAAIAASSAPRPIATVRSTAIARAEPIVVAATGAHVRRRAGLVEVDGGAVAILSRTPIRVRYGDSEYLLEGGLVLDGAGARVERVLVTSGVSSLARGQGPTSMRAGEAWQAPDETPPAPSETASAAIRIQPPVALGSARATSPTVLAGGASPPPQAPREPTAQPAPAPTPAAPAPHESEFTEGVRLIEHGAYGAANERLEAFRRAHPSDARAEDAAFLEIVALDRAGRKGDARAAARRYLTTYPNGFRRAEAEALAH